MRDSVLFNRGLYGKFYYCESWQEIFSRVKESILSGEADSLLRRFGHDPKMIQEKVSQRLQADLNAGGTNMRRPIFAQNYIPPMSTFAEDHVQ